MDLRGPAVDPAPMEENSLESEHASEEAAEKWAVLLSQQVAHTLNGFSVAPEPWHGGAGRLTQGTAALQNTVSHTGTPSRVGGKEDGLQSSLSLRVDAGELGEIELFVERTSPGMKVQIGVDGVETERMMLGQRAALERALSALGLRVQGVTVVRTERVGTSLAHHEARRSRQQAAGYTDSSGRDEKTKKTRLNLVG